MTSYSRNWVPSYSEIAKPLYPALKEDQSWDWQNVNAFLSSRRLFRTSGDVRQGLCPRIAYRVWVSCACSWKTGIDLRMFTQLIGPSSQPVKYLIKELDQVAKVWPGGLCVVAVVRILTPETPQCTLVPLHGLWTLWYRDIVMSKEDLQLTDSRLLKYQSSLWLEPEIAFETWQKPNPVTYLPEEEEAVYSCEEVMDSIQHILTCQINH